MIVECVSCLKFLRTAELITAIITPIIIETMHKLKKLPIIRKGVDALKLLSGPQYFITVLNKMILTASLDIPSPNITLKSFGYCSYFTTATAATTSDEQIREHTSKISITESSNYSY